MFFIDVWAVVFVRGCSFVCIVTKSCDDISESVENDDVWLSIYGKNTIATSAGTNAQVLGLPFCETFYKYFHMVHDSSRLINNAFCPKCKFLSKSNKDFSWNLRTSKKLHCEKSRLHWSWQLPKSNDAYYMFRSCNASYYMYSYSKHATDKWRTSSMKQSNNVKGCEPKKRES